MIFEPTPPPKDAAPAKPIMPGAKREFVGSQQRRVPVWLILGPSGAGKSSFGKWLTTKQNWLHLEIDPPEGDGISLNNLRREWDEYYKERGNAQLLGEILQQRVAATSKVGCVLTFSGCLILTPERIGAAAQVGIRTIYFYGSAAHCITTFLNREQKTGRHLDLDHWLSNNRVPYIQMSEPAFAPYRIHVFTHMGNRRRHVDVFNALLTDERSE